MNGTLDFFYYRSHEAKTYVDFHQHNCFELVYYETGKGAMNLDGRTLPYEPGSMTLTRPNFMHDERHDEATDVMFFGFRYDDQPFPLRNGALQDTAEQDIHKLILTMKEELLAQRPYYAIRVNLLLNETILLLGRLANEPAPDNKPEKLVYARRFIDENFTQSINLHTLAELSGYSMDHFRHLFKEQTGLPPAQYIIRRRLEAARRMLQDSELSVSAIGMECGFSTTSQFIELFKRAYGRTPLQYRKYH